MMIDKGDYDLLQEVIRQDIDDRFGDGILPVQYDAAIRESLEP